MGFDFENDKSNDSAQLSLFDVQVPNESFSSSKKYDSTAADFQQWLLTHREPEQSKTSRFITLSATAHLAAILAAAMVAVPLVEATKTETITIEIEETPAIKMPRGAFVPPSRGGTPATTKTPAVEKLEKAGSPGDVIVSKPTIPVKEKPKTLPAKLPAKMAVSLKTQPAQVAKSSAHGMGAKTTFNALPLSVDDIEAPELDSGELSNTALASNLNEDFDNDFSKVNQTHETAVDLEKKSMDAMAAALEEEQNQNLSALDEANKEDEARMLALQNSLRQKNANTIASALASERAAAAAREAAAKAAQKRGGLGGNGNGSGIKNGSGAGNSGSPGAGSKIAGLPSGIRSLEQLRQMPGNKRPQYDREERRRGDQGEIAFIAYISKDGYPIKFRLLKSTGFRNLDAKTLAALKKWRFYPGQEGWVELPFRWDLKGGVQQDGGTLRRFSSR